jgi:2-iminobutanoate/2-iminopropanoate deaminase
MISIGALFLSGAQRQPYFPFSIFAFLLYTLVWQRSSINFRFREVPMKHIITTDKAPNPIGPYSQAIRAGGLLFLSGQTPMDPATGQLVEGDIAAQTARALDNLKAVVEAAGSSLDRVVKTTVYMKDLSEFAAMNEVYAGYFSANPPARSTIEAARLPRDCRVEIDLIAEA